MRSTLASIPHDSRTRSAGTAASDSSTDWCVIACGTSISDSTPPSDSASEKTFVEDNESKNNIAIVSVEGIIASGFDDDKDNIGTVGRLGNLFLDGKFKFVGGFLLEPCSVY